MATNEAFSRVKIDAQIRDQGWDVENPNAVRFEYVLPDATKADYVLCDRNGRSLAVIEAKRSATNPADAARQARAYAEQLGVPFIFLANGEEVRFWDWQIEAHPRVVKTVFSPSDLERRFATRVVRKDPRTVAIDRRIVERDYQTDCIDALTEEFHRGRRKMLVEMATGTGKTRTAAAVIKRLFEANAITRVLFLVDRNTLAKQTEDAFAEHLPDYPCYRLQSGRRFQDEKRITITTLQSMINIYRDYSAGYFDLVISDECHRSIYGKWRGVLEHFDGVQIGLTATPCVAHLDDEAPDEEDTAFVRDTLRFFEVDKPTFAYKMKDAIRDGYLVPYQIYKAQTVKTAAEGGFPVARSDIDWTGMSAETRTEFEELFRKEGDPITVDPSALERRFTVPERNRAMVREYKDVLTKGYMDAKGIQRKPLLGKTIVFAVTKRHAETLARLFDEAFAEQKPSPEVRFADYVVSGLGADDSPDGETIIKRFKKEKYPEILVSVNMLDTGFDCPEVVNLVFARFTKSAILYQQMRGRGTRKSKGKPLFTMFDFVGVSDYHGDEDATGEGGRIAEARPRKTYTPRRLLVVDVDDHIDPLSRAWVTVDEDGRLVFPEAAEAKVAELGARFEAWLYRALNGVAATHDLRAFAPVAADPVSYIIGTQYEHIRCRLFHAKPPVSGAAVDLPSPEEILSAYEALVRLWRFIATEAFKIPAGGGGGTTYEGFRYMMDLALSGRMSMYFTADPSPVTKADVEVSPLGRDVWQFDDVQYLSETAPGRVTFVGAIALDEQYRHQSTNRVCSKADGTLMTAIQIESGLDLSGVDYFESRQTIRLVNPDLPRTSFGARR